MLRPPPILTSPVTRCPCTTLFRSILPYLGALFGADLEMELAAMLRPAPIDVRINPLKTTRDAAAAALAAEELRSQPTPFSPLGLRLSPLAYVNNTKIGRAHV